MRNYKFRGFDNNTGRWYYGNLLEIKEVTYCFKEDYDRHPENTKYYIVFSQMTDWNLPNQHFKVEVDKDSIGEFTGLMDKNGKEIYEGDIVKYTHGLRGYKSTYEVRTSVVHFDNCTFYPLNDVDGFDHEVIGNIYQIYQNKDLLEKKL